MASHNPVGGDKLIGLGRLGTRVMNPATQQFNTIFGFSNPDCKLALNIKQVSVIKSEWNIDPTVIYEGPYIRVADGIREIVTTPMKPHESRGIVLSDYMYNGVGDPTDNSNWLSAFDAQQQTLASYTVEIAWEANSNALPLIGFATRTVKELIDAETYNKLSQIPMVHMKQPPTPKWTGWFFWWK